MTSPLEISIRAAATADAEEISRLVSTSSREFIIADYTAEGAATLLSFQSPEAIRELLGKGMIYLIAESDEAIVGAAGLIRQTRHLYHLFVDRLHHRKGIGHRLWNEVRSGLEPGPITVNSSRFAIPFYEQLGFAATGPSWEKGGVVAYPMRWEPDQPIDIKGR